MAPGLKATRASRPMPGISASVVPSPSQDSVALRSSFAKSDACDQQGAHSVRVTSRCQENFLDFRFFIDTMRAHLHMNTTQLDDFLNDARQETPLA